ncbi:GIN domain-containing protein [Mucilaginibacter glaciei]|uniref:DUF2807 domain-containing protein n=1 Tax=Mucilaginibacter glaciei TaxID=2772109 RepID=A0A926S425_9SPHI|nr:DUF2807 domain-containing protein [Mucilaginibacter glaciei]MBD1394839.1 DUF2807 domain-containing protein [Mucilaginibacter glaciei]
MKIKILTLIAVLVTVLGANNAASAKTITDDAYTLLNDISAINKIEVHGNVELYISDANTDQVKIYNKYYAESALVQSKNGVLRISSYKTEKLVVWVSANDLRSVSVFDNSTVKSFGNISKIEFAVDLHNNATAQLNLAAYQVNLSVKDNATAALKGNADLFTLKRDDAASVKSAEFAANYTFENKIIFTAGIATQQIGM